MPPGDVHSRLICSPAAGAAILERAFGAVNRARFVGRAQAQPDMKWEFLAGAAAKIPLCRLKSQFGKMQGAAPHALCR